MRQTTLDWNCECGASARNVPVYPATSRDIGPAALAHHGKTFPCELTIYGAPVNVLAVREDGAETWTVTISSKRKHARTQTLDEHLRRPCGICGKQRAEHIGRAFGCPGGFGTSWSPDGDPDPRLIRPEGL